jgi:hypothetical protein
VDNSIDGRAGNAAIIYESDNYEIGICRASLLIYELQAKLIQEYLHAIGFNYISFITLFNKYELSAISATLNTSTPNAPSTHSSS